MDKGIGAGEPTDSAESSEASEPEKHQDETPEKEMADEIMEEDGSKNVKTKSVVFLASFTLFLPQHF